MIKIIASILAFFRSIKNLFKEADLSASQKKVASKKTDKKKS